LFTNRVGVIVARDEKPRSVAVSRSVSGWSMAWNS